MVSTFSDGGYATEHTVDKASRKYDRTKSLQKIETIFRKVSTRFRFGNTPPLSFSFVRSNRATWKGVVSRFAIGGDASEGQGRGGGGGGQDAEERSGREWEEEYQEEAAGEHSKVERRQF